jgi:hypothetical protein
MALSRHACLVLTDGSAGMDAFLCFFFAIGLFLFFLDFVVRFCFGLGLCFLGDFLGGMVCQRGKASIGIETISYFTF